MRDYFGKNCLDYQKNSPSDTLQNVLKESILKFDRIYKKNGDLLLVVKEGIGLEI
jgi:hypothetical protein